MLCSTLEFSRTIAAGGGGVQKRKKMWDNLKTHFNTAHHEIWETSGNDRAMGYSEDFMPDKGIKETENEAVTSLENLTTASTANRQSMKILAKTNSKLTTELVSVNQKV